MEADREPDREGLRRSREGGDRADPRKERSEEEKRAEGLALRAEEANEEAMARRIPTDDSGEGRMPEAEEKGNGGGQCLVQLCLGIYGLQ